MNGQKVSTFTVTRRIEQIFNLFIQLSCIEEKKKKKTNCLSFVEKDACKNARVTLLHNANIIINLNW